MEKYQTNSRYHRLKFSAHRKAQIETNKNLNKMFKTSILTLAVVAVIVMNWKDLLN